MRAASPGFAVERSAITIILEAIDKAGYRAGKISIWVWMSPAPNFQGRRLRPRVRGRKLARRNLPIIWRLGRQVSIVTVEDGMSEGDWTAGPSSRANWNKVQLVVMTCS